MSLADRELRGQLIPGVMTAPGSLERALPYPRLNTEAEPSFGSVQHKSEQEDEATN